MTPTLPPAASERTAIEGAQMQRRQGGRCLILEALSLEFGDLGSHPAFSSSLAV